MKRSLQEYVELVVFGLIALLVGTGLLWVVGWVLSLGGIVLKGLAGLLWMLLRFIVPVAIAGGLVYFLVKAAQGRQRSDDHAGGMRSAPPRVDAAYSPPAPTAPAPATPASSVGTGSAGAPEASAADTSAAAADVVADFDEPASAPSPATSAPPVDDQRTEQGDELADADAIGEEDTDEA